MRQRRPGILKGYPAFLRLDDGTRVVRVVGLWQERTSTNSGWS